MAPKRIIKIGDTNSSGSKERIKRPRKIIDLETKLKVIKKHEAGSKLKVIAHELDMGISTVWNIIKHKSKVTDALKESTPLKTTRLPQKRQGPKSDMEILLASWIKDQTQKGIRLKPTTITAKALSLFKMLKEKAGPNHKEDFNASSTWLTQFKQNSLLPKEMNQNSSNRCYAVKQGTTKRINNASSPVNSLNQQNFSSQPNAAKIQKRAGQFQKRFENNARQALRDKPSKKLSSQTQGPQHLQSTALPPASVPTAPKPMKVLAPPVQVEVTKPKPVEKPWPRNKRIFIVADHQRSVMANLSSLWKSGKLCDAGIGNGTSTVMVHKLVLFAVCPRLLSLFNADILSHEFLQLNFPEEVSREALNAFSEYMYNGILDLDIEILEQLKIVAKRLDMNEFEQLCDSHLLSNVHQPSASFANIPSIQTTMSVPTMTSSHALLGSPISNSVGSNPSITTQIIDVKQEITEADLVQVQNDTAAIFGRESAVAPLAPNKSGNAAGFVICPSIKTEPIGPKYNKYGHLSSRSSSSNQVFKSTTSPSSSSSTATAKSRNPFSQSTGIKSTRLKTTRSYKAPLVSDLSPVSRIGETVSSQSRAMKQKSSRPSSRPLTSVNNLAKTSNNNNNKTVYPIRLVSAKGDNLPLLTTPLTDAMTVNSFYTK